jgi:exonuclease VII small subunit
VRKVDYLERRRTMSETSEVEGQIIRYSDETLKQAIQQLEDALGALEKLKAEGKDADEVEGQIIRYSDKTLKQAIQQVESALSALGKLKAESKPAREVEAQTSRFNG